MLICLPAEFTLSGTGQDNYDLSNVDGFNVPISIDLTRSDCKSPACSANINDYCPSALRVDIDADGHNLGCESACVAGLGGVSGGNKDCCTGQYNPSTLLSVTGGDR